MAATYTGEVRNGVVVFDEGTPPLAVAEGSRYRLVPIEPSTSEHDHRTLADRYAAIIGIAEGLPSDMATEHDHYIHGTPRVGES